MKKLLMQHEEEMRSNSAKNKRSVPPHLNNCELSLMPTAETVPCPTWVCMSCSFAHLGKSETRTTFGVNTQHSAPVITGCQVCVALAVDRLVGEAT